MEFLISARVPDNQCIYGQRVTLSRINSLNVVPVKTYSAIGIGQELATAIFEHRFRSPLMDPPSAAIMLVDAIRQVKRSVIECGKSTDIVAVLDYQTAAERNWGKSEIEQIEADCVFLESVLNPLLTIVPSDAVDTAFEHTLEHLCWLIRERLRNQQRITIPFVP